MNESVYNNKKSMGPNRMGGGVVKVKGGSEGKRERKGQIPADSDRIRHSTATRHFKHAFKRLIMFQLMIYYGLYRDNAASSRL